MLSEELVAERISLGGIWTGGWHGSNPGTPGMTPTFMGQVSE